jgi:hypothetical protein
MAQEAVMACSASGWQAERFVFFGTPEAIAEKVQATPLGIGRRLFYATIEHAGTGKVYEYQHKKGNTYEVKVAETNSADALNHAVESAIFSNKGQSCVGEAIQSLPEFKTLKFQPLTEVTVTGDHNFGELLGLGRASQHAIPSGNPSARFTRASFSVLC